MLFQSRFRNVTTTRGFDYDSPCIWIVYPPGAAGDLWGAIVGQHYPRTGNHFLGLTETGRVVLDTIDHKWLNFRLMDNEPIDFGDEFIWQVNRGYGSQHFPYSMSGQCILVNHLWLDTHIDKILNKFPLAKVIRIMPDNVFETNLINWLGSWKNRKILHNFDKMPPAPSFQQLINDSKLQHPRLLELKFGELWSPINFEKSYDKIVAHLDLPYKLVRYDLVKFWFDSQHEVIKPHLLKVFDQSA